MSGLRMLLGDGMDRVGVVVTGVRLSEMAGFPVPDIEDSPLINWPEKLWTDVVPLYNAGSEIEPLEIHQFLAGLDIPIITTSIDGLHSQLGWCVETNGSIRTLICIDCGFQRVITDRDEMYVLSEFQPPECDDCGMCLIPDLPVYKNGLFDRLDDAIETIMEIEPQKSVVFLGVEPSPEIMTLIDVAGRTDSEMVLLTDPPFSSHLFDAVIAEIPLKG